MGNSVTRLATQPRSLTEELFGRPAHLKIFVSSKMAGRVYEVERRGCARAIDGTGIARAWYWERDANAGPYCSAEVCLGHAATADGLILILGDDLTPITRQEFEVATARGVATFVFIDQRASQGASVEAFISDVRQESVTKGFGNLAELETHVLDALQQFAVQSWRRATYRTPQGTHGARSA